MLRPQTISKTYVGEWGFTNGYFVVRLMTWVGGSLVPRLPRSGT